MDQKTELKPLSVPPGRVVFVLLLALSALVISGIVFVVFVATQRSSLQGSPSPDAPIVGTWKNDLGLVVNYRPDGTARYRGSGKKVHYFEWNLDESNELRVYHMVSSKSAAWKSRLSDWVVGNNAPRDRCDVIEISRTGFKLRSATGDVFTFTSTTDTALEIAP